MLHGHQTVFLISLATHEHVNETPSGKGTHQLPLLLAHADGGGVQSCRDSLKSVHGAVDAHLHVPQVGHHGTCADTQHAGHGKQASKQELTSTHSSACDVSYCCRCLACSVTHLQPKPKASKKRPGLPLVSRTENVHRRCLKPCTRCTAWQRQ